MALTTGQSEYTNALKFMDPLRAKSEKEIALKNAQKEFKENLEEINANEKVLNVLNGERRKVLDTKEHLIPTIEKNALSIVISKELEDCNNCEEAIDTVKRITASHIKKPAANNPNYISTNELAS